MKITKFQHACVLIEEAGQTVIFDPGIYSYESGIVDISKLPRIDFKIPVDGEPFEV